MFTADVLITSVPAKLNLAKETEDRGSVGVLMTEEEGQEAEKETEIEEEREVRRKKKGCTWVLTDHDGASGLLAVSGSIHQVTCCSSSVFSECILSSLHLKTKDTQGFVVSGKKKKRCQSNQPETSADMERQSSSNFLNFLMLKIQLRLVKHY